MTNVINEKEIKIGNAIIIAREENGIVSVDIKSEDAVVRVNDDIVWSVGNEKEEFKYIPKNMHSLIIKSGDYLEYQKKEKQTVADVSFDGEMITFYIPVNQNEVINGRFDLITSVELLNDEIDCVLEDEEAKFMKQKVKEKFDKVKKEIEKNGYKMIYSHDMSEWLYAWWDMTFKAKDFDEEKVRSIMKEVREFNEFLIELRDKMKLN